MVNRLFNEQVAKHEARKKKALTVQEGPPGKGPDAQGPPAETDTPMSPDEELEDGEIDSNGEPEEQKTEAKVESFLPQK